MLCEGDDPRVRAAAERLRAERIAEPIVLGGDGVPTGDDPRLARIAQFLRDRRPDRIVDGVHALDLASMPVNFGAALVALGEADAAVAGAVCPTRDTIRAALWAIGTAPGVDLVSSAFYMVLPGDAVLTFTDCAVVPEPTPEQLARSRSPPRAIARGWWATRRAWPSSPTAPREAPRGRGWRGCGRRPRGSASWRPTSPPTARCRRDAALVAEVIERKAPGSALAGRANVLVFPDLDAGNIAYKLVQRLAGARGHRPDAAGTRPAHGRPVARGHGR